MYVTQVKQILENCIVKSDWKSIKREDMVNDSLIVIVLLFWLSTFSIHCHIDPLSKVEFILRVTLWCVLWQLALTRFDRYLLKRLVLALLGVAKPGVVVKTISPSLSHSISCLPVVIFLQISVKSSPSVAVKGKLSRTTVPDKIAHTRYSQS